MRREPNYLGVFGMLVVLTMLEVAVVFLPLNKPITVVSLVVLAVVKAGLVALYFMHLRFEGRLIYVIAAFPLVLAMALTLALLRDQLP